MAELDARAVEAAVLGELLLIAPGVAVEIAQRGHAQRQRRARLIGEHHGPRPRLQGPAQVNHRVDGVRGEQAGRFPNGQRHVIGQRQRGRRQHHRQCGHRRHHRRTGGRRHADGPAYRQQRKQKRHHQQQHLPPGRRVPDQTVVGGERGQRQQRQQRPADPPVQQAANRDGSQRADDDQERVAGRIDRQRRQLPAQALESHGGRALHGGRGHIRHQPDDVPHTWGLATCRRSRHGSRRIQHGTDVDAHTRRRQSGHGQQHGHADHTQRAAQGRAAGDRGFRDDGSQHQPGRPRPPAVRVGQSGSSHDGQRDVRGQDADTDQAQGDGRRRRVVLGMDSAGSIARVDDRAAVTAAAGWRTAAAFRQRRGDHALRRLMPGLHR